MKGRNISGQLRALHSKRYEYAYSKYPLGLDLPWDESKRGTFVAQSDADAKRKFLKMRHAKYYVLNRVADKNIKVATIKANWGRVRRER